MVKTYLGAGAMATDTDGKIGALERKTGDLEVEIEQVKAGLRARLAKTEEAARAAAFAKADLYADDTWTREKLQARLSELTAYLTTLRRDLTAEKNLLLEEARRVERASRDSQGRSDASNHSADLVEAWAIRATIQEKETGRPCFFRMRLSQKLEDLRSDQVYVYGSCEREGRKTEIDFLVESHQHRTTVCNAILAVAKLLEDAGYLEVKIDAVQRDLDLNVSRLLVAPGKLAPGRQWDYKKKVGSPNEKYEEHRFDLVDASFLESVTPEKFPKPPSDSSTLSTLSKTSLDGTQGAHVLWQPKNETFKKFLVTIMMKILGYRSRQAACKDLDPLLKLVWDYDMRDHHNYDSCKFYFRWAFTPPEPGKTLWTLTGIPVFLIAEEDRGAPTSPLIKPDVTNESKLDWQRALALRKAATFYRTKKRIDAKHLKAEWSGKKDHSECWELSD